MLEEISDVALSTPKAQAHVKERPEYCQGTYDQTLGQRKESAGMTFSMTESSCASSSSTSSATFRHDGKERQHILCLGAGLVVSPLVEYLTRDPNHSLTVDHDRPIDRYR